MVEDTKLVSTVDASAEEHQVGTLAQIPVGENIRKPGSDVRKGDLVLEKGEILRSVGGEIGTLVFVGRKEVCISILHSYIYHSPTLLGDIHR